MGNVLRSSVDKALVLQTEARNRRAPQPAHSSVRPPISRRPRHGRRNKVNREATFLRRQALSFSC